LGGISNGTNGQNAFYMPPFPVPHYESPLDYATLSVCSDTTTWGDSTSPNYHVPCVPYRNQSGTDPALNTPLSPWTGTWTCDGTAPDVCGTPDTTVTPTRCTGGNFDKFYRPNADSSNSNPNRWQGTLFNNNGERWRNINETAMDPAGSLPGTIPGSAPLSGPVTSYVYSPTGIAKTYRVALAPVQGVHMGGRLIVRYVLFRTAANAPDTAAGPAIPVQVRLLQEVSNNNFQPRGTDNPTATEQITVHQFPVDIASTMTGANWFNQLHLEFSVPAQAGYGVGISWAEVEEENLQPREAPRIPPGYWKTITIPDNKCALLDPAHVTGLKQYQLPGVFRLAGNGNNTGITIGNGAFLIGDGVSLVFDPSFANNGLNVGAGGALLINAGATADPPLSALPYAGSNAAWQIDANDSTSPQDGTNTWPVCTRGGNECVPRACYMNTDPDPLGACAGQTVTPITDGRGITFYLTPNTWTHASVQIKSRFQMGGNGEANAPGIAFKGVLYAPYDDVKITGRNGFNTVGQVMSWTAKFNGGNAYIELEYPYTDEDAPPYLLEPTIDH
jgi:hypothetical protein